jgi:hypothetical protein
MKTRFVTLCLGDKSVYAARCQYAMLSVLAHCPADCEVAVVTDHPQRFAWMGDAVRVYTIDAATVRAWKGPYDYFFRTEIEVLRYFLDHEPANLVYLDSDVIVRKPLADFVAALENGAVFMHLPEEEVSTSRRGGVRRMWREVEGKTVDDITLRAPATMWNAGLMAVRWADRGLIERVARLTDGLMNQGARHWLVEQFSYGVVFNTTGRLQAGEPWMDHWWGNKPGYDAAIAEFLLDVRLLNLDLSAAVERFKASPIRLPMSVRVRWWHRLLKVDPRYRPQN